LIGSIGIGTAAYIANNLAHTLLRSAPPKRGAFLWSHYSTLSGRKQPQRYKFYVNSYFAILPVNNGSAPPFFLTLGC
jgi:hypothetical protein